MGPRDRAVLFCLLIGFAMLFFEVRFEHRSAVNEHWQAWIPIAYSLLAALGCLFGMAAKKGWRTAAATIFFLGLAVGGYGLYMHTDFNPATFRQFMSPNEAVPSGRFASDGRPIPVVITKPLAAPLSMAGLAVVGFVLTSGLFKSKGQA